MSTTIFFEKIVLCGGAVKVPVKDKMLRSIFFLFLLFTSIKLEFNLLITAMSRLFHNLKHIYIIIRDVLNIINFY